MTSKAAKPWRGQVGFSLIELLAAMTITLGIGAVTFQLFRQNVLVFRDQDTIMDAQQAARAGVSEIADEIRMAGQGVPVFSASYDELPQDGVTAIMAGSGPMRINLRSSRSNAESPVTGPLPVALTRGVAITLTVADAAAFATVVGSNPAGKFAYIWGATSGGWGWSRASLSVISAKAKTIQLTPVEIGGPGTTLEFNGSPTIVLEEGVTIYYDAAARSIRLATLTDASDPIAPVWAPANELVNNVTALTFRYFDRNGEAITPDTTLHRASIGRIEFELAVEVENALSNGSKPVYPFSLNVVPRNLRIR